MNPEPRSDERIHHEIRKRLSHAAHVDSHDVSIHVTAGVVRLDGSVRDGRTKDGIEAIVRLAEGVRAIDNCVRDATTVDEDGPRQRWLGVQNATAQTGAKVPPGQGDAEAGS